MPYALNSVSKNPRGEKNSDWMYPPTWILSFTHPSIRINYASPTQSPQAALKTVSRLG